MSFLCPHPSSKHDETSEHDDDDEDDDGETLPAKIATKPLLPLPLLLLSDLPPLVLNGRMSFFGPVCVCVAA